MRKAVTILLLFLLVLVITASVVVFRYAITPYYSLRPEILASLNEADQEERHLVEPIRGFLLYKEPRLCSLTARALTLQHFLSMKQTQRQLTGAGVSAMICLLWDQEELLAILAHRVYMGKIESEARFGLQKASQLLFKRPLSQLSLDESIELVLLMRVPTLSSPGQSLKRAEIVARWREEYLAFGLEKYNR